MDIDFVGHGVHIIEGEICSLKEELKITNTKLGPGLWKGSVQRRGPEVYASLTPQYICHKLKTKRKIHRPEFKSCKF